MNIIHMVKIRCNNQIKVNYIYQVTYAYTYALHVRRALFCNAYRAQVRQFHRWFDRCQP